MKNKFTTTVEIIDSHIKVMRAITSGGGATVIHLDIKEIVSKSDAEISKTLSGMISTAKIKVENLIVAVPRRFTILRHVSLPSHADQEIEKMISLQITQQVPYPKEDVVFDYTILGKESSGYSKILIIAVHKDVVNRYLKIFSDSSLHLNKLTLSSDSLLRWHSYRESRIKEKTVQPVALINIEPHDAEICFFHRHKLLFSRSIHFGAKDLNEENIQSFSEQIGLTMVTYVREKIGGEISKIILVSNVDEVVRLKERLQEEHKVLVEIADPVEHMCKKRNLMLPLTLKREGVSVAVNLGLLLIGKSSSINLLPFEVADTRRTEKKRWEWIKFIILFMLTFSLAVGTLTVHIYKDSIYLGQLEDAISKIEPKVNEVKGVEQRLEILEERFNPSISSIDIIYELYNLTPNEISFSLLHFSENDSLTLQGVSKSSASVNVLQSNLVESPLFEDITLQYVTKRKVFKGELTDFKIICQILR